MVQSDSNVVPIGFKNRPSNSNKAKLDNMTHQVVAECRKLYNKHLANIHHEFFDRVDDELFELSDKAESSSLQSIYFEAMRFVRKERQQLERQFSDAALRHYDDFWRNGVKDKEQSVETEIDEDNFSLVENEALEEDLAISTMIDKGCQFLHSELYGVNRRFAVLIGLEKIENEDNPVAPGYVCHALESVIKPLILDLKIKLIIYKLYDQLALCKLESLYKDINQLLISQGILPKLSRNIKRKGPPATGFPGMPGSESHSDDDYVAANLPRDMDENGVLVDPAAEMAAFQSMQSLLSGWRGQNGMVPSTAMDNAHFNGPVFAANDVLNALSLLQGGAFQSGHLQDFNQGVKLFLSNELNSADNQGEKRPIGELEEDVIDMVEMIFDYILGDEKLPDSIKVLIGRLQIPIVKVAIIEKGFFARKSHSARKLLNIVARAGADLDDQSCTNNPVFVAIEAIVNRILNDFTNNVEIFSELYDEFSAFMEKDEHRSRIIEERTRQVTESKEQLSLAKSKVIYELAKCMQGKELPVVVKTFLTDTWKDVMVLSYLRKDKESVGWENSFDVVNRLIWSVTPPVDNQEKQQVLKEIPRLIKDIRGALENISFDPHQMTVFFKDLENSHVEALNSVGKEVPRSQSNTSGPEESSDWHDVSPVARAKDQQMAAEIEAMAGGLMDVDEVISNVVNQEKNKEVSGIEGRLLSESNPQGVGQPNQDEYVQTAESLEVGQWLSFKDESDEIQKAKLSWKSHVTSKYVFVNRKGVKIAEKSLNDLAKELRSGIAKILENTTVPVMDRALAAMMATIKPEDEPDPLCV